MIRGRGRGSLRKMEVEERRHKVSVGLITHQTQTHRHTHTDTREHTELWWLFLQFLQTKEELRCVSLCCQVVCKCEWVCFLVCFSKGQGDIISVRWSCYIWHQSLTHCLFGPHRNTHVHTPLNSENSKNKTSETCVIFIAGNFWLKVRKTNIQGIFIIPKNMKNIDRRSTWEFCSNFSRMKMSVRRKPNLYKDNKKFKRDNVRKSKPHRFMTAPFETVSKNMSQ